MLIGRNRSSFWCDNRLGFRWRNKAEVFHSELIPSKDISQGGSGFSPEGSIIPRIFMSTLIKEQYFSKSRPRFPGNWPGGELLTVQENLKAKLIRSTSRLRTGPDSVDLAGFCFLIGGAIALNSARVGIFNIWLTRILSVCSPLNVLSWATVMPNFLAMRISASPCFTS